jgi:hypothetical protein
MHGNYQWTKLQARLDKIHAQLMLEVQDWRAQGTQQTALRKRGADSAVNSCVDYLAQQQERIDNEAPDGVSVGVDEANVCVWVATIFGPAAGFTVPPSAALVVRPLLPRRRKASSGLGAALRTSEECPSRPGTAPVAARGAAVVVCQRRSSCALGLLQVRRRRSGTAACSRWSSSSRPTFRTRHRTCTFSRPCSTRTSARWACPT